jgi:hypothetical protein
MPQAGLSARRDDWFPEDARLNEAGQRETRAELREVPRLGPREDHAPEPRGTGARVPGAGVPGRRTVAIQGRGAERYRGMPERRRPASRRHERAGFKADRAAMWAVVLGVLMILAAATSSHAAMLSRHAAATHHRPALVSRTHAAKGHLRTGARVQLRLAR